MRAMVLCAGRGERLRPLTDVTPKPLIEIAGKPLLARHLERLAAAGFHEIVINTAHLPDQIESFTGDGSRWGVHLRISQEPPEALETGGGMLRALPLLGREPFLAVNGDVWTDFPFASLHRPLDGLAHLVLVDNPGHHSGGDFGLIDGRLSTQPPLLTFSGIGVYHPDVFAGRQDGRFSVVPLIRQALADDLVSAEHYLGQWFDIGGPQRLRDARAALSGGGDSI